MHFKLLFTSILLFLTAQSPAGTGSWQDCLSLSDDAGRLACYDAYAKELSSGVQPEVLPTENAQDQETAFGKRESADDGRIDEIHASVASLQKQTRGRWLVTLDNDQLWQQVDSRSSFRIREGDAVVIKRGAFGSFVLRLAGANRSIRVKRLR